ncbi:PHP domain-containing protein [Halanaerobacter jeridensis]|uniref:Metal-dependent phosphoesterase TrpH n=1 Tax=Halanaerobacter jeridensis TaxID=706427 RepID=A0A938XUD4_9FIRM|nr:PHP domain-containing protein [Halanaerobacter jeridensis]MBM7558074.1 putative metal-dependent phosphoesterase TrpH [Halanaerobacter jeridensis]
MNKKIDLHLHTTASDGSFTPEELVAEAEEKDLAVIAVTDHDTVAGVEPALEAAENREIKVIPGIEFTTYVDGQRVDILGYNLDYNNSDLLNIIDKLQNARQIRAQKILDKLAQFDINLNFDKLQELAGETGIGRPHIARLMVQEGYVNNMQQAFDDYLEDGGPAYVPKYKLAPQEAVELITGAEGKAVLAHPGEIEDRELVKELIQRAGLNGIEAYYSKHTKEQTQYYLDLAEENDLFVTGGSDCHGPANEDKYLIATVDVPFEVVNNIL